MKTLRTSAALLALLAAACDRPTAPQARDSIEVAQRRLLAGNIGSIDARIGLLIDRVRSPFSSEKHLPSSRIAVERGGSRHQMTATVFERVYVPPKSVGGRPFVRRTVFAWEDSTRRGIVLLSDDAQSGVTVPTRDALSEDGKERLFGHLGFVLENEPNEQRARFGRDGELEIGDGAPTGDCPFAGKYAGAAMGVSKGEVPSDVTCQTAEFLISARTTLATGDPNQRSVIGDWLGAHPSLIVAPQTIRGIRIVTQCADTVTLDGFEFCPNVISFWRESSQFAPQLGVELSTFRVEGNTFWKLTAPGSGRLYSDVPVWPTGPVHYTVYSADGNRLADSTVAAVESTPWLAGIMHISGLRPGARGQIVARAGQFNVRNVPPAMMAVMNFELMTPGAQR